MTQTQSDRAQSFRAWLLAARPKTLTAALVPIIVATSLAFRLNGSFVWWIVWDAFLASLCIQIGTNLINDALDFKKGADTDKRIGPKRATQMGWLSMQQVLAAGIACFFLAILFGVPLIIQGGGIFSVILLASVISGYLYTGGPYPLAYYGLGDIFVMLFFGWISTMAVYYLQTGTINVETFIAGTQVGSLCTVLLAVNNLRDVDQDEQVDKKTLAVRFGSKFVRLEITVLMCLVFVLNLYWFYQQFFLAALLPYVLIPFALKLIQNIWSTEPSSQYNNYLADAAKLHLIFGILFSIGICLS